MKILNCVTVAGVLLIGAINPVQADTPEERLAALGYILPAPVSAAAMYVTSRRVGNLLYLSGHVECQNDAAKGKVGRDLTTQEGFKAAENVGLCMLSTIRHAVGDLSQVKQFVQITGMVNATEDFTGHSQVMNGFSALMVKAYGQQGLGARASVGMQSLPGNYAVEISATVELK